MTSLEQAKEYIQRLARATPIVGQDYLDVKDKFSQYSRIILTGCNRTGTTFFSQALSKDLGYTCVDEGEHDYQLDKFNRLVKLGRVVVQAPGMVHRAHLMCEEHQSLLVVIMVRPIEDILMSALRIRGTINPAPGGLKLMMSRYRSLPEMVPFIDSLNVDFSNIPIDCSQNMRYTIWKNYQRDLTKNYIQLNYDSLCNHPTWIDKADRENFHAKQTR
mgnify:CR=1 FL=1